MSTAVSTIEEVDRVWGALKYMDLRKARFLRSFIIEHKIEEILELGFFHGKSTAFMAAILEERARGHITTMDQESSKRRTPPITEVLETLHLSHRVTPVFAFRSFTWELSRLLEQTPQPQFDFCYIDGAHTWDGTGFAFFLIDVLLKPGGWVIFDDLDWTIAGSPWAARNKKAYAQYSVEEKSVKQIRKVWDLLVPTRGYVNRHEQSEFQWGVAQKPLAMPFSTKT